MLKESKALDFISLSELDYHDEIVEDGKTLEENATIKSSHIYKLYKKAVISEDTGLEITALNMRPGVKTARYAGEDRNNTNNMNKVLSELSSLADRSARFRTIISFIDKDKEYQFEGIVNGKIAEEINGDGGFGYDPIFIPEGYDLTFANLDATIKNQMSHRFRAMEKFIAFIKNYKF
jgi:XTP/dITP diphosphohydrolase